MEIKSLTIQTKNIYLNFIFCSFISAGVLYLYFHFHNNGALYASLVFFILGVISTTNTQIIVDKNSIEISKKLFFNLIPLYDNKLLITEITAITYKSFVYQHTIQTRCEFQIITHNDKHSYIGLFLAKDVEELAILLIEINPNIKML